VAYDGTRVFALNSDSFLTAFVASTGQVLWSHQFGFAASAPPTAYDGVVYISTRNGTVVAVSEADGRSRWAQPVLNGDMSSPAVDDSGVYVSYAGPQTYRFSLGGQPLWHYAGSSAGGGGSAPVLQGGYVYARGYFDSPLILAKSSEAVAGTFASVSAPAFDSTNMYTLQGADLVAVSPSGSANRWTFANGNLGTAPVVNNGVVYVGSGNGRVYGISARSGAKVWAGTAGTAIAGPVEDGIQTGLRAVTVRLTMHGGPSRRAQRVPQATTDHDTRYVIKSTPRAGSANGNNAATAGPKPPLNGHAGWPAQGRFLTITSLALTKNFRWLKEIW